MQTNGGVPLDADSDDLPIDPATPIPTGRAKHPKQDRTRLSLNLSRGDYLALKQLSQWWNDAGIHGTITRAVTIATRLYGAEHPDLRWADWLDVDTRPRPGYWALHVPKPTLDDPDHEDVSRITLI